MNYIKGRCTTNLDNYIVRNIKGFAKVPDKGDGVVVLYGGRPTTLRVCSITHDWKDEEPYIIVELTH